MYKESTNIGENSTLVTEEKIYGFLYYQSRRPQKKHGKKKKRKRNDPPQGGSIEDVAPFNIPQGEYIEDIAPCNKEEFIYNMDNPHAIATKPVGYSIINQFRSAILKLYQEQVNAK